MWYTIILSETTFTKNINIYYEKLDNLHLKNENLKLSCKIYIEFNKFTEIYIPNSFNIIKYKM